MKKYIISIKFKKHIQRRMKYQEKRRNIKKGNRSSRHFSNKPRDNRNRNKHIVDIEGDIIFPQNINKIKKYVQEIKDYSERSYYIAINHKKLRNIDNISILIFTALLDNIQNKKYLKSKKLKPKKEIDERLLAIGYWKALCYNIGSGNTNLDYLRIKSHDGEKIDNGLHMEIVNFFTQRYDIEKYKDLLFDAIFEAMANATEHAYNSNKGKVWLLGSYDKNRKQIEFVFYDIGMGIFKSLEKSETRFGRIISRCVKKFGADKTLVKLCTTDLSKYKEKKRGLGMQAYKKFIDAISKERSAVLEVITDNLRYSSDKDIVEKIKVKIQGTLIIWRLGEKDERKN